MSYFASRPSISKEGVSYACSIQLEEMVVVTGGRETWRHVTVYNTAGLLTELPDLEQGRSDHGCGHFVNTDNKLVRQS